MMRTFTNWEISVLEKFNELTKYFSDITDDTTRWVVSLVKTSVQLPPINPIKSIIFF